MKLIFLLFVLITSNLLLAQSNLIIPDFFSKASTSITNGDLLIVGNSPNEAGLIQINSSNIITLAKKIPGMENISALEENNNSIYITGTGNSKQQIIKLNSIGVVIWAKETQDTFTLQEPFLKLYGDTLLTGFISADGMHISILDTNGNILWTKSIPFSTSNGNNIKSDGWKSGNDTYIAFSYLYRLNIAKISSSGNLVWHTRYYDSSFLTYYLNNTICKSPNRFTVNGNLQDKPFIFEIDSLGNLIQAKSFTHTSANFNISAKWIFENNSFYLSGFDDTLSAVAISRHYIAQFDTNYNQLNQIEIGDVTPIKLFNNSIIYHNSQFEYTRNYGNLTDTTELLRFQNLNQIVCDTSSSSTTIINHSNFTLTSYTTINNGPSYVSISPITIPYSLSLLQGCPIMSTKESKVDHLEIYPNPNSGQFTIDLPEINKISELEIYNSIGQKIHCQKINPNENYKNLMLNLESGIYFILLESENEILSRSKMIVE
jgi:hypothetical protein